MRTVKMQNMRKVPLTPENQGSEEIPRSEKGGKRRKCRHQKAENAENADTKTRKMRLFGFIVIGFRWPPNTSRDAISFGFFSPEIEQKIVRNSETPVCS